MKIYGLQKLTLLDYPGKVACTVFVPGCNFRCEYCHNMDVVNGDGRIPESEVLSFLSGKIGKLDGVAITGGEPCLQDDLPEFIRKVKDMGFLVKLDTNGSVPEMLKRVVDLVDYIAMDFKSDYRGYKRIVGVPVEYDTILKSAQIILERAVDYEFRTTVVGQVITEVEVRRITRDLSMAKRYVLQCFVQSDGISKIFYPPDQFLLERLKNIALEYVNEVKIRF